MDNKKFQEYAVSTIIILKELAKKARKEFVNITKDSKSYIEGTVMGYYSIITLLKQEAFAFSINQKELGLADITPDVDLLGLVRNPDIDFEKDNWSTDDLNEEKIKGYLSDSITLLKEQAKEIQKEIDNPQKGFEDYTKGEWMAYCSLFSILQHQASVFHIDEKEIGFTNIEER